MRKALICIFVVVCVLTMMFAEYRFIMYNLKPYRGEGGTVYIEFLGHMDTYYADPIEGYDGSAVIPVG